MDEITKPKHYTQGKVECITALESMMERESFIDYLRAQALKYVWRLRHKGDPLEDAKKAQYYINFLVSKLS
jgi:hypothetical protein